jgi:hypothetical protein
MIVISGLICVALAMQAPSGPGGNDLDRLCRQLVSHDVIGDSNEIEFNLRNEEVSRYMIKKFNSVESGPGGTPAGDVARIIIKKKPVMLVEWLLDHYDEFSSVGLCNMAECLGHVDNRESFELLFYMLQDKRVAVNEYAAHVSARPFWHERVCDRAYSSIGYILYKQKTLPNGMYVGISCSNSPGQRDAMIRRLGDWWGVESSQILKKALPLAATRQPLQSKVASVLGKPHPLVEKQLEEF